MNQSKNNFQIEFANTAGMLASRLSLSPIVGQIYGLLYMSPEPVSLNEMVKKLGISKGSASTNVRILESWGAVKKVWVDNSRRDYYEANPETLQIIINRIKDGLNRRLNESRENLGNIEQSFGNISNDDKYNVFCRKRIDKIRDMYETILGFIEMFSDKADV